MQALNDILKRANIDEVFESNAAEVELNAVFTRQELAGKIRSLKADQGWICFTDEVVMVDKDFDYQKLDQKIVLSGELANGKTSIHIRQGDSGWIITKIHRIDGGGAGDQLMVNDAFIGTRERRTVLYETYWRKRKGNFGQDVFTPYVSRFAGFKGGAD